MKKLKPRTRAKIRIRKKVSGIPELPRLTVYRSLNNIYVQIIDDSSGTTLVEASTLSKELSDDIKTTKSKIEKGKLVGKLAAKRAVDKKINSVVFDRNGYKYHGRVQAVAEGAREGGLKF